MSHFQNWGHRPSGPPDTRTHLLWPGNCGSCWAVAATGVLGDRFCVHKAEFNSPISFPGDGSGGSGALNRMFQAVGNCQRPRDGTRDHGCVRRAVFPSPQALLSCGTLTENSSLYPQDAGCNGGNSYEAWRFYRLTGAPSMDALGTGGCVPYTAANCATPGGDPLNDGCRVCAGLLDQCQDTGLPPMMYRVDSYGLMSKPDLPDRGDPAVDRPVTADVRAREVNIMREIATNGPVMACIFDYANFVDFYNKYPLGIYNSTEGADAFGGHCLTLLGWGVDAASGMKYWLMRNSWGPGWGNLGVARIKKGVDFLGIESDVWAACPSGAAHCSLTAGVDTSVMDNPDPALLARLSGSAGGGKWLEQKPDAAAVLRAAAAYVAAANDDDVEGLSPEESSAYLAGHGVSVVSAQTQVVNGFRVRLQLDVPPYNVAPAQRSDMAPHMASNAVSLLATPAPTLLPLRLGGQTSALAASQPDNNIHNYGCLMDADCAGARSSSASNGHRFCCPPGCGNSCSISIQSNNGKILATCACSARLQVDVVQRPGEGLQHHGLALRL